MTRGVLFTASQIHFFVMSDVATCLYGDCADCALRQIIKSDFSEHACHGGIDAISFEYILPCSSCCERWVPATQDYQDYELDAFFEGQEDTEDLFEMEDDDIGSLIFGDSAEEVFIQVMKTQKQRWPHLSIPLTDERDVDDNGQSRRFRFYKPFQIILEEEQDDFKEFLKLIF